MDKLSDKLVNAFLKNKIKKKVIFINNLETKKKILKNKKELNLIISKSGNTLEIIVNSNILNLHAVKVLLKDLDKSLLSKAKKLKAEIINHNNFIGGRYSVLSEVGMLPAELNGFKFK